MISLDTCCPLLSVGNPGRNSRKNISFIVDCKVLFPNDNVDYRSRSIREWAQFYIDNYHLPQSHQGRHIKTKSLIDDEDVQNSCRIWVRSQIPDSICGRSFALWITESLHHILHYKEPIKVHERTPQRWLHSLDFSPCTYRQGLYFDGHERGDVVAYRKKFLDEMASYQKRMFTYVGDNLETAIRPEPRDGEQPIILVTHDESCFSSHEGKKTIWMEASRSPLRPKGQGRSIMVSEFLCECHGRLQLLEEQHRLHPGTYVDGHKIEDVVAYRNELLLRMAEYEKQMVKFSGEHMEVEDTPALCGMKRIVVVTHDESVFSSHDGRRTMWTFESHKPLRPKGQGRSLMVSEFMCECHGPLRFPPSLDPSSIGDGPTESLVILKPGKNADGYWKNSDLVEQLTKKAIPIFEILHPDSIGLFIFDNSQNHHALPPDGLRASTLNLNDGGKNAKCQRDGWFLQNGVKTRQSMVNSQGLPKGAKTILQERGLWHSSMGLAGARALLIEQPDFKEQTEWLEEVLTSRGHMIDFYPKFHPEFNFIEMYWGHAKAFCRRNCDYTFPGLQRILPAALKVPLESIRRFARKCFRYMDAYRINNSDGSNLTSKQIEYAVKKYKSHRSIPVRILNAM